MSSGQKAAYEEAEEEYFTFMVDYVTTHRPAHLVNELLSIHEQIKSLKNANVPRTRHDFAVIDNIFKTVDALLHNREK